MVTQVRCVRPLHFPRRGRNLRARGGRRAGGWCRSRHWRWEKTGIASESARCRPLELALDALPPPSPSADKRAWCAQSPTTPATHPATPAERSTRPLASRSPTADCISDSSPCSSALISIGAVRRRSALTNPPQQQPAHDVYRGLADSPPAPPPFPPSLRQRTLSATATGVPAG